MKCRPALALRPLSLAATTLFRGSVALRGLGYSGQVRTAASPTPATRLFAVPQAAGTSVTPQSGQDNGGPDQDFPGGGRARSWSIPWGNEVGEKGRAKGGGGSIAAAGKEEGEGAKSLTRRLKTLPGATAGGAAGVGEPDCFRIMSFNMLAQQLASSKMFPYVPKNQLKKNNRWPRVQAEVSRYGADIICLQECDSYKGILASLRQEGEGNAAGQKATRFEGVYKKRDNSSNSHGVAIFFDSKMFRLVDSGSCEYGKELVGGVGAFALLQDRGRRRRQQQQQEVQRRRRHEKDHSLHAEGGSSQADRPSDRKSSRGGGGGGGSDRRDGSGGSAQGGGRQGGSAGAEASGFVCVATTHLYWHPDGGSIRLAQAEVLMASVAVFLQERFGDDYGSVPVVLAGDLNNVPGVDVYRLLADGACEGGTPEAFLWRRRERARARKANQVAKAREAIARIAEVRVRNAAAISAARSAAAQSSTARPPLSTATVADGARRGAAQAAAQATGVSGNSVCEETAALGGGADKASNMRGSVAETSVTAGGFGVGNADPADDVTRSAAGVGSAVKDIESTGALSVDANCPAASTPRTVIGSEHVLESGGSTGIRGTISDSSSEDEDKVGPPASAFDISKWMPDEDVRRYEQDFHGLRSAYGAYSSVFSSQLSDSHPRGESTVCETTGKHTIGHLHLGARPRDVTTHREDEASRQEGASHHDQRAQLVEGSPSGEPQLTTCTHQFAGTIDYIWHTPQLQVRSLLELPSLEQVMQGGGLPTTAYPSDHLSIMAELCWRQAPRHQEEGQDTPPQMPRGPGRCHD